MNNLSTTNMNIRKPNTSTLKPLRKKTKLNIFVEPSLPLTSSRLTVYDEQINTMTGTTSSSSNQTTPRSTRPLGQQQQQQQQQIRRDQYNDYDDDIIVKSTDLPATYEQDMIELVRTAFRKYQITNQRELAGFLKRSADRTFAPCWHCIVGRQFSSYVTHEMNGFIYFTKGPLSILLFKSGA